jgi:hypothetical protein
LARIGITALSIALLTLAVILSKRGSIAEEQAANGQAKAAA